MRRSRSHHAKRSARTVRQSGSAVGRQSRRQTLGAHPQVHRPRRRIPKSYRSFQPVPAGPFESQVTSPRTGRKPTRNVEHSTPLLRAPVTAYARITHELHTALPDRTASPLLAEKGRQVTATGPLTSWAQCVAPPLGGERTDQAEGDLRTRSSHEPQVLVRCRAHPWRSCSRLGSIDGGFVG